MTTGEVVGKIWGRPSFNSGQKMTDDGDNKWALKYIQLIFFSKMLNQKVYLFKNKIKENL